MAFISFQPKDYFATKLYTGTGSSLANTGVGFQPDLTWIKSRSNSYSHTLTDAVRGVTKHNASNNSNVEYTSTTEITSFDSDGFTVGTDSGVNNNGSTFASWNWKAGTAVSGATTGSGTAKTYTGSVNTTAGVSIIRYTGNSASGHQIPHRLGVAPKMIIVKCLNQAQTWTVYHQSLGSGTPQNYWLHLDTTDAQISGLGIWNNTAPNATNFTVGDSDNVNGGLNYVAYCFANILPYPYIPLLFTIENIFISIYQAKLASKIDTYLSLKIFRAIMILSQASSAKRCRELDYSS